MTATKPTLAELKTLSRLAFPGASLGWNFDKRTATGTWYSEACTKVCNVSGYGGSRMAARRQLRDLLTQLLEREHAEKLRVLADAVVETHEHAGTNYSELNAAIFALKEHRRFERLADAAQKAGPSS